MFQSYSNQHLRDHNADLNKNKCLRQGHIDRELGRQVLFGREICYDGRYEGVVSYF